MAKSNHQPFEDWIFSRETISREDELALQEHLRQCEDCNCLSESLQKLEFNLKAAPVLSPAPGFSARWMLRVEENRARHQKKQMAIFFSFMFGGAVLLLPLFIFWMLPVIRAPYPYALALAYQAASIYSFTDTVATAVITLYRTIFKVIPPSLLVSLSIATTGMVAIWIAALGKLVYVRRVSL